MYARFRAVAPKVPFPGCVRVPQGLVLDGGPAHAAVLREVATLGGPGVALFVKVCVCVGGAQHVHGGTCVLLCVCACVCPV
jgi:hypothetical protein